MDLDIFTFVSAVELADGTLLVAAQDNNFDIMEHPHTVFLLRSSDGTWKEAANTGFTSAGISNNANESGIAAVSADGECVELRLDGHARMNLTDELDAAETGAVVRFIKSLDGEIYAGGTNRYIFQHAQNGWEEIGVDEMRGGTGSKSFDNITGFGRNELYAFGWRGIMWSNEGGKWHQVETPTNLILNDGDIHGEKAFIGGQVGTILTGRGDAWELIENDVLPQDIWSVRSYGDAVYFSAMSGILRWKDDNLTLFKGLGPDMRTAMCLCTGPSGLWSIGASDIALFDGEAWQTIAQSA